ncbi:Uncharacterised protein [Mycobacterium tuberculosis]|nr:Uncharacterised protein [Mycobacterium tuberculosis]
MRLRHRAAAAATTLAVAEDNVRWGVNVDQDYGKYWQYAGPAKVKGRGMCISIIADTYYYDEHARLYKAGQHCG